MNYGYIYYIRTFCLVVWDVVNLFSLFLHLGYHLKWDSVEGEIIRLISRLGQLDGFASVGL